MATDCSALEQELNDLNRQQSDAALALSREPESARTLDDLAGREQGLSAAVDGYRQVISDYDNSIKSLDTSMTSRIREYEDGPRGLTALQAERRGLVIELRTATDTADRDRIENNIKMVDLAVQEHEAGIRQMKDTLATSLAEMRRLRAEAERDVQSHQRQLEDVRAELPAAQAEAEAAAAQTAEAFKRLEDLKTRVAAKQQQVQDCHDRRREEENPEPPHHSGDGWFRP
jgi:chromosome segregation ATPase